MDWLDKIRGWRRGLQDTRRRLEVAKQRMEALESAPLSQAEACKVQLEYVSSCERYFASNVVEHAQRLFTHDPWTAPIDAASRQASQFSIVSPQFGSLVSVDPRLIVGALAPQMRDAIQRAHAAHGDCWATNCGPPLAERRTEMARLKKEIAGLEAELAEAKEISAREGLRL